MNKIADAATYGGSGAAIYFGFTPGEWQAIGVMGGLIIGAIGLAAKILIDYHFKQKHYNLARKLGHLEAE